MACLARWIARLAACAISARCQALAKPGTVCVCASQPLRLVQWDMVALDALALAVLDALVHDGWHVGRPIVAHTVTTPRIFSRPVKMAQRRYWRCLSTLDSLRGRGVEQVLSGQPPQYYSDMITGQSAGLGIGLSRSHIRRRLRSFTIRSRFTLYSYVQ